MDKETQLTLLKSKKQIKEKKRKEHKQQIEEEKTKTNFYNYKIVNLVNKIIHILPFYLHALSNEVGELLKSKPVYTYHKSMLYLINNGIVQYGLQKDYLILELLDEVMSEKSMILGKIKMALMDERVYTNDQKSFLIEILAGLLRFIQAYKIEPMHLSYAPHEDPWDHLFDCGPIALKRPPLHPYTPKITDLPEWIVTDFGYVMEPYNEEELRMWLLEPEKFAY